MYKLNVSPEHLAAFAYSTEKFKNRISNEYEQLQQKNKAFQCCLDDVTGDAFKLPIQKIGSVMSKQCEKLDAIIKDVNVYTDKVRSILHKMELHKNTIKETTAAIVGVAVSDPKIVKTAFQVTDAVLEGIELATGKTLKPPTEPIFNLLDNLIDNDDSMKYQGLSISKEQVDSHTLVIGDANEPWKK